MNKQANLTPDQKLSRLRLHMTENDIDAVIITGTDPHQSEYLAEIWQDRFWLSGFTGSSGSILVTHSKAYLITDSRYLIQATAELKNTSFELVILDNKVASGFLNFVKEKLSSAGRVALDGFDIAIGQYRSYEKGLGKNHSLITNIDLVAISWDDRPSLPSSTVFALPDTIAGVSLSEKLAQMRVFMKAQGLQNMLISALDEIAWLLNLRGADVDFNPIFVCYLLLHEHDATLFCDRTRILPEVLLLLDEHDIKVLPYSDVIAALNTLEEGDNLGLDPATTSLTVFNAINAKKTELESPIPLWKSKKNDTEVSHSRNTMVKDGIALANAFYWLHEKLKTGDCSEYDFANILTKYRSEQVGYVGDSFAPIVGFNGNGAIVHYRPTESQHGQITNDGVLLVDSGGQYMEGTTDITRTFAIGTVPKEARKAFTLVLKGMIALSKVVFPVGVHGAQLDILARQFLWENGQNYGHGTGHGVGFFLNVHEGPQSISPVSNQRSRTPLEVGMITSNEPGFYLPDHFGIRVENLILCQEHKDFDGFLHFETLSLYPIDIDMLEESLMDVNEKTWFNNYHDRVKTLILPHLEEPVKTWFELKCRPLN